MSTSNNWPIYGSDGTPVTVGAASAVTQIGARDAEDVLIDNPGPLDVFVKAGPDDTVAATLNSVRVPAGSMQPFRKGEATYLAMRTAAGSQPVVVHMGFGS